MSTALLDASRGGLHLSKVAIGSEASRKGQRGQSLQVAGHAIRDPNGAAARVTCSRGRRGISRCPVEKESAYNCKHGCVLMGKESFR